MEILGLILLCAIISCVFVYNRLTAQRNRVKAAWSDIDVQLTRRYDLVPQLVSAVKQYADYELATFKALSEIRKEAQVLTQPSDKGPLEEKLGRGVIRLLALSEDYPTLKANENFLELQKELVDIEDYLQSARRYYNGAVRIYNTNREIFPNNIISSAMSFLEAEYFEMEMQNT